VPSATISPADLDVLQQNYHLLDEKEQLAIRGILKQRERGFRTNRWIQAIRPNVHPKQRIFLSLEDREVLYGGSAGCGKSDALLLAALQYCDVPDYAAILFRKTFVDLSQSGALMDRARSWFQNTDAKWSANEKSWMFPTGRGKNPARIAFAYMQNEADRYNYQGSEWQFAGFDELTQHSNICYSYLFSRLRRLKGSSVPIRMRSSSNPGGEFYEWVMEDFLTEEYLKTGFKNLDRDVWSKRQDCGECKGTGILDAAACMYCEGHGFRERLFVPARLADNPSLDRAEYARSLIKLTPIERQRLEFGDWSITDQGDLFRESWMRFYSRRGEHFVLHRPGLPDLIIEIGQLTFFLTCDTASKEKTTADFTCISAWAYHARSGSLILIHSFMDRIEVPKISDTIIAQSTAAKASFVMIESAQCGIGVIQELRGTKGNGIAVKEYNPNTGDKVSRATPAVIKMEAGQVYFPTGRPTWFDKQHAQLIGFPKATHDDFVDTFSQAAYYVHSQHQNTMSSLPSELARPGY